jgi:hypothetical protein
MITVTLKALEKEFIRDQQWNQKYFYDGSISMRTCIDYLCADGILNSYFYNENYMYKLMIEQS